MGLKGIRVLKRPPVTGLKSTLLSTVNTRGWRLEAATRADYG